MTRRFLTGMVIVAVLAAAVGGAAAFFSTRSSAIPADAFMPADIDGATTQSTPATDGAASQALATHRVDEAVAATVATTDGPTPLHLLSVAGSTSAMDEYVAGFELTGTPPPAIADAALATAMTSFEDAPIGDLDARLRTVSAPNGERVDGLVRITPQNVVVATSTSGDRDAVTNALRSMIASS